jgi:thiamine monophosphate synthase
VKTDNIDKVLEAGTDTVVVGSSIFSAPDVGAAAREIRSMMESLASGRTVDPTRSV